MKPGKSKIWLIPPIVYVDLFGAKVLETTRKYESAESAYAAIGEPPINAHWADKPPKGWKFTD